MDRATFQTCLHTMPGVAYNLALSLARRLRLADARLRALASLDVEGRMAHTLLHLAREYGRPGAGGAGGGPPPPTPGALAAPAGAARGRGNPDIGALTAGHLVILCVR